MVQKTIRFLAVAYVLCSSGCQQDQAGKHGFAVYTEDGIEHCVSTGGPKYNQPIFRYQKRLTLEQDESRPETLIHGREWVYNNAIIDEYGLVYFSDVGNYRIIVFDSSGAYLRSFGRQGRGPGDFMAPVIVGTKGNSVIVLDRSLNVHRLSRFSAEGLLLGLQSFPHAQMATYYVIPIRGDTLAFICNVARYVGGERYLARNISVIAGAGDTLGSVEVSHRELLGPYQAHASLSVSQDGRIVMALADEPVIRWFDIQGQEKRRYEYHIEPKMVTNRERRAIRKLIDEELASTKGTVLYKNKSEQAKRSYPDQKDWCEEVWVDSYGFTWTEEAWDGWSDYEIKNLEYRIFSPSGELLGYAKVPEYNGEGGHFDFSRGRLILRYLRRGTDAPVVEIYAIFPNVEGINYGEGGS